MKYRRLTKNNFRSWLLSYAPSSTVGIACDGYDCPLTRFVNSVSKGSYIFVSGSSLRIGDKFYRLPKWTVDFTVAIDCGVSHKITANKALKIFLEVT